MISVPALISGLLFAAASKSGSSAVFLLILVAFGGLAYFMLLRPQQQRAKKQRSMLSQSEVGDEIVTVGGIVGTILEIDEQRVTILTGLDPHEQSPDAQPHRIVLLRQAIARKLDPPIPPSDDDEDLDLHRSDSEDSESEDSGTEADDAEEDSKG